MGRGLHWKPHEYYTFNLLNNKSLTLEEMRAEYNRLRVLANSRIKRLGASEFAGSEAYKQNVGQYEKTARQYTKSQLAKKLYQVSRFIGAEQGSVQGQRRIRKKMVNKLHEAGYSFVNEQNLKDFGAFMEDMRSRAGGRLLDSDRVAEVFGVARELGVDSASLQRDFDFWVANVSQLSEVKKLRGKRHDSATYLNKLDKVYQPKEYRYSEGAEAILDKLKPAVQKSIRKKLVKTSKSIKELAGELDDDFI